MGFFDDVKKYAVAPTKQVKKDIRDPIGQSKQALNDPLSRLREGGTGETGDVLPISPQDPLDPFTGQTIEDLIRARTPEAMRLLETGTGEALRLSDLALSEQRDALTPFADTRALEEQRAILGLSGQGAQEQAIGNIPVSDFDRELQERQQRGVLRRASATGDLGSGASIDEGQRLAGAQQAQLIQQRLSELEPLVAASRGVRSTLSSAEEAAALRKAGLESGLGAQKANIRLGSTAPIIESRLNQAELSGLRGVSRAQQQGQIAQSLAGLAGQYFSGD